MPLMQADSSQRSHLTAYEALMMAQHVLQKIGGEGIRNIRAGHWGVECAKTSSKGHDGCLTCELDESIRGSSTHPLSLECVLCLPFPLPEATPRTLPWNGEVTLRPSGRYTWQSPVKPSITYTLKILVSGCDPLALLYKSSLMYKFPCLLPATYLSGVAWLFLWLPLIIHARKPVSDHTQEAFEELSIETCEEIPQGIKGSSFPNI